MQRVSLIRCERYDPDSVKRSVSRALELLGGAEAFARPGDRVFIKVNAVMAVEPSTAIVTHPEVVRAVIRKFQEVTDRVVFGDSPGGPFTRAWLKRVYEKTGLADVAADTGAELSYDTGTVEVQFPEGRAVKRLTLCRSMVEADCLVSVSKFKTHRYLNLTGPVKNLYGAVPGMNKLVYHSRFEDPREFAELVVDVHIASRPRLHLVDAVEVIDGEGSRNGSIRRLGALAAGANAFALETLMLELVGLDPDVDRPLAAAVERGACPEGFDWFTVLGEPVDAFRLDGFRLPGENLFSERVPALITGRMSRFFTVTPRPDPVRCTGCGKCATVCPRGAIAVRGGLARVDASRCIRCFCCEELCEYGAVGMHKPLLIRLAEKAGRG